jgi:hypothetical protein
MVKNQEKHPGGAPTKYKEEFACMAYVACVEGGFTDEKLGLLFDVSKSTINRWKKAYPQFWDFLKAGKEKFDTEVVEKAFLKRCTGFSYNETTKEPVTNAQGETKMMVTKRVRKMVVPDAKGCMDWLTNRAPDRWKKVKHVAITGQDAGPVQTESLVAVPSSGPMSIAQWEAEVREARKADPEVEPGHIPGPGCIPGNA